MPTGWKKPRAVARTCTSASTSVAGPQLAAAYGATSGRGRELAQALEPSTSTSTSRSSRTKPWSIASGVSRLGPFSLTDPRERGFITNAAPLISQPDV